jgi:hypothetical protein
MEFTPIVSEGSEQLSSDSERRGDTANDGTFKLNLLARLYLLADKLIDSATGNLAIDELIVSVHHQQTFLDPDMIKEVYACTTEECPLRRYIRDHFLYDAGDSVDETLKNNDLPYVLLRDIVLAVRARNFEWPKRSIKQVYGVKVVDRTGGHYHWRVEKDSPETEAANPKATPKETSEKGTFSG